MFKPTEQPAALAVAAVLLAAGEGSRMGGVAKSLFRLNGQALLSRQIEALKAAGVRELVVVTGNFYEAIEAEVRPHGVFVVRNPTPEAGQQSSVRLGLQQLRSDYDFTFITLADQPLLATKDFIELIAAFAQRGPDKEIRYPVVEGNRGNPVALSKKSIDTLLKIEPPVTCRDFIKQHPELVNPYTTVNDHFIIDIDTEQDLISFQARTGQTLLAPEGSR